MGFWLFSQKKYEKAVKKFQRGACFNKSLEVSYSGIGVCLSNLGKYEEAAESFEKATSFSKKFTQSYLHWTLVLLIQGKGKEALEIFENVKKCDFDSNLKDLAIKAFQAESVSAKQKAAQATDQYIRKQAQKRHKCLQILIDLIKKTSRSQ